MSKITFSFCCFLLGWCASFAQSNPAALIAETITASELKNHLSILASDEFEGRETGTEGQRKAADYLAQQFKALGLPTVGTDNSYFQKIAYTGENWEQIELHVNKKRFKNLWNFYSFPSMNRNLLSLERKEVIFLGYGIDDPAYSDYQGVNVTGKVLLIYQGEPTNADSISFLTGSKEASSWAIDWKKKLTVAHQHGAIAVLFIDGNIQKNISEHRRFLLSPRMRYGKGENPESKYANSCFISTDVARTIMGKRYEKVISARDGIRESGKPKSVRLKCKFKLEQKKQVRQLLGSNVLGFIEGTDPEVKDQVVVVTAHYDHLGKKGVSVFNGADDNGSGTSAVLEVAQALAEAKEKGVGPRRSVLCMLVSGEEKGLLGSQYYSDFPIFPLENTVANVNVDMIGRTDQKHEGNPNYIYVIGADRLSTELHDINEAANTSYTNLELDYTFNAPNDPNRFYYRSDHYNFAKKGIPAIFYFSGVHRDYHQPSDTVEKINFEKMEKITKLVFHTTWELANREKRIEVDVKE